LRQWRQYLPNVTPHYAVKSNNDPVLLSWLGEAGAAFDCASPTEFHQVLKIAPPAKIIYANPCKSIEDICIADGVPTTVVDSPEEVEKLADARWSGSTLIRLKVPDAGSAQPFSRKFGAPLTWVPEILAALRAAHIPHTGWSFHVGSMCAQPRQFSQAIALCAAADKIAGTRAGIVDIGGGFVPGQLADAAAEIRAAQTLFPAATRWIGEPGRFLSAPVATLRVSVIGSKRHPDHSGRVYTIDESVYSAFSNIPFDGQKPEYILKAPDAASRPRVRATIFGRTCDSADCLAEDILLPELRVGDELEVPNMGAYTMVSASLFNGFPLAKRAYI
jgi:ornithine decarboxylase